MYLYMVIRKVQPPAEWNVIPGAGNGTSEGSEAWTETRDTVGLGGGCPQGDAVSAFAPVRVPCIPGDFPPNRSARMAKVFPASLATGPLNQKPVDN